jgi:hypothetical protein
MFPSCRQFIIISNGRMAREINRQFFASILIAFAALALAAPGYSADPNADDDEPINLSPVKKGSTKPEDNTPTAMPTAAATAQPTATAAPAKDVVTATPTVTPTLKPTPRPKPRPARKLVRIEDLSFSQDEAGLHVRVEAASALKARVSALKNPDRILVSFSGASLGTRKLSKDIGLGSAVRARLAQHPGDEVWLVIDLVEPVPFKAAPHDAAGFSLLLETGTKAAATPAPAHRLADLPKVDLMFFDLNVLYQGVQYERFPCANFIYDKTDKFPIKRKFETTMVFHDGFGAFIGNLRIVDPKGNVIDTTKDPIAFNLFSKLFDYSATKAWEIEFPEKGFYSLILQLNGEDVLEHPFYVGHNDDTPDMKDDKK